MCIGIIWDNSFFVGRRARAEARIDPRPLRTSCSTAHGAQVVWPLDYMGRAVYGVIQRKERVEANCLAGSHDAEVLVWSGVSCSGWTLLSSGLLQSVTTLLWAIPDDVNDGVDLEARDIACIPVDVFAATLAATVAARGGLSSNSLYSSSPPSAADVQLYSVLKPSSHPRHYSVRHRLAAVTFWPLFKATSRRIHFRG